MAKKTLWSIMLLVFLLGDLSPGLSAPSESSQILSDEVLRYFELVRLDRFSEAAGLFYYSEYDAPDITLSDHQKISQTLEFYKSEFGEVLERAMLENPAEMYYTISIGSGRLPFGESHSDFIKLSYKAQFQHEGKGLIEFLFCNVRGFWKIRQVGYGLPIDREDTRDRMQELLDAQNDMLR